MNDRHEQAATRYREKGYWQEQNFGGHLRRWAERYGDHAAVVDDRERLSYRELDRRVDDMAAALHHLGLRLGDRVLLQLPNGAAFVITAFALFRLGVIPVMMMTANRDKDAEAFCRIAEPAAYITTESFLGFAHRKMAERIRKRCPCLRHVIVDGALVSPESDVAPLAIPDGGLPSDLPEPAWTDTAVLLLSGGTTGVSKLIPRTHTHYHYNAAASAELCGFDRNTVYLAALPAAHNFPLACPGIIGALSAGGTVVLARTPAHEECFALIEREKATHCALVPSLVRLWVEAREWERHDLSSLRLLQVGAAALDPGLAARIRPALGCRLQQVFGTAEGLLCFTRLDDPEEVVLHTQGRPLSPDDEVRIVDDEGRDVPPGTPGELLSRGPYTIRGYYNAPEQNRIAFTEDGYYRNGDLVRITPEGNFVVEGRIKDTINRAGEKVAAAEVEAILKTHPDIADVALAPLPDEHLGERACAFVITRNEALTLKELRAFLLGKGVAAYKVPDQLELADAFPLTPVGKIDKRKLAETAMRQKSNEEERT